MDYNTWVQSKFPSIISVKVATNKNEGASSAIYALKDREFNLVNVVDDIAAIYNNIELYDNTLFFDRFYFIFKDTISNTMKVISVLNTFLLMYTTNRIDFDAFTKNLDIRSLKIHGDTN